MRAIIEFGNKRVDIKAPIRKIDSEPETVEVLRRMLAEALTAHGLKVSIQLAERDK